MPHPLPPPRPIVAGVDGCRAGWLVVLHDPATNTHAARVVTAGFAALLTLPEAPAIIAVDIPIGLLDVAATGGRACEIAARERLPGRTSSVFSSPTRPALAAQQRPGAGYRDVVAANRSGVDGAPGISQQAFAILPKIGEVDAALTPALQAVVREIHPELCFATAAGAPMAHAKKTRAGQAERICFAVEFALVAGRHSKFRTSLVQTSMWRAKGRTTRAVTRNEELTASIVRSAHLTPAMSFSRSMSSARARGVCSMAGRRWSKRMMCAATSSANRPE